MRIILLLFLFISLSTITMDENNDSDKPVEPFNPMLSFTILNECPISNPLEECIFTLLLGCLLRADDQRNDGHNHF